ncbi:MAG: hypothetical protein DMD80_01000 [Candidatus Rokuibacteriota bacterium]|nr:MAG: hypothetical protein DMD80_01000 [Candidatus Rokubacteria bacterium]
MSPGSTVMPATSINCALDGHVAAAPVLTVSTRPSAMTTVAFAHRRAPGAVDQRATTEDQHGTTSSFRAANSAAPRPEYTPRRLQT